MSKLEVVRGRPRRKISNGSLSPWLGGRRSPSASRTHHGHPPLSVRLHPTPSLLTLHLCCQVKLQHPQLLSQPNSDHSAEDYNDWNRRGARTAINENSELIIVIARRKDVNLYRGTA